MHAISLALYDFHWNIFNLQINCLQISKGIIQFINIIQWSPRKMIL